MKTSSHTLREKGMINFLALNTAKLMTTLLVIGALFTINSRLYGQEVTVNNQSAISVPAGTYFGIGDMLTIRSNGKVDNNGTIMLGTGSSGTSGACNVSGILTTGGTFTHGGTGNYYNFNILSGGKIRAKDAIFNYMTTIDLSQQASPFLITTPDSTFNNCTFQFWSGAQGLLFNNATSITGSPMTFNNISNSGYGYNIARVTPALGSGIINITGSSSGNYWGEALDGEFDGAAYNYINWTDTRTFTVANTVNGSPANGTYYYGASNTVLASSAGTNTGYCCTGWIPTGDAPASNGTGNCPSFAMSSASSITWIWTPISAGGSATANPATICTGGTSVLTLTGNLGSIQWQTNASGSWADISGETNPTYNTPVLITTTSYRAVVTSGGCTSDNSTVAQVTVVADPDAPTATKSPADASVCAGQTLTLINPALGNGGTGTCTFEYRYNDGTGWTGWNSAVPSFSAVTGTNYFEIRTNCNGSGCDISSGTQYSWTVVDNPTISITGPTDICYNTIPTLTATVTGGLSMSFQWQVYSGGTWNNVGTDSPTYTPLNGLTANTDFRCNYISTGAGCSSPVSNTFTVTLETQPPTLSCPSNFTVNNDAGQCYAVVTYAVSATDNCALQSYGLLSGYSSGSIFPVATTYNSYIATDLGGNSATCTFAITVIDNEKPTFSVPVNQTRSTDNNECTYTASGSEFDPTSIQDNCGTISGMVYVLTDATTGSGTSSMAGVALQKGTTTVTWLVSDGAVPPNTQTMSFLVTVNDNQLPWFSTSCPSDITVHADPADCGAVVTYITPVGADNCTGQNTILLPGGLVSGSTFPVGVTTNTFKVTDASSNTFSCSFTVTVLLNSRTLNVDAYLQGLMSGAGQMHPAMDYDISFNYVPKWGSYTIADMITIVLHDGSNYNNIIATFNNVQLNTDGTSTVSIPSVYNGSYRITVKQRNHLETTSALPVSFDHCVINYDFRTNINQAYRGIMKNVNGIAEIYAGDPSEPGNVYPVQASQDGVIDISDIEYIFASYQNGDYGYIYPSDVNGDGTVDLQDAFIAFNNYILGVYFSKP